MSASSHARVGMREALKLSFAPNPSDPIAPVALWMSHVNAEALLTKGKPHTQGR